MYDESVSNRYRWHLVGGHVALDLCNTISWRLDPQRIVERLRDPRDLIDWFGIATGHPAPADVGNDTLDRVRRLRDGAIRLVDAHLDGRPAPAGDVRAIHDSRLVALRAATLCDDLPLTETIDPATPTLLVSYLALATAELLHRPDLSALRRCDGDGCGWLFLDTTRNHSRRWCDALDCGNRARVRAYARRHRR